MVIRYLGHSCFYIQGEEFSVVTDPFKDIGYDVERVTCDYALSSHSHFDHDNFGGVNASVCVTKPTEIFNAIESYHDEVKGKKRGKNNIFVFTLDGVKFCHMGDIGEFDSLEKLKEVGDIDVLFIPVGGTYTIDSRGAMYYIENLRPKIAVPMHYRSGACNLDISTIDGFLSLAEKYRFAGKTFNINKEGLSTIKNTEIIIMEEG